MNIFSLLMKNIAFIGKYKVGWLALLKALFSPSFICSSIYRFSTFIDYLRVSLLPRILWWLNFIIFKVDLDQRSRLMGAVYFPHPMCIVVGQYVKSNKNSCLKIMQGATIGGDLGRFDNINGAVLEQPVFCRHAFIGVNAIVAGPVVISEPVFIDANSVLSRFSGEGCYYSVNQNSPLKEAHRKELKLDE